MSDSQEQTAAELRILFVDDELVVLDSARKLLRKEPFELVTAASAEAGLELLEAGGIQVVLTDLKMPAVDGLEFTRRIKERWPAIPVVIVTGYATVGSALAAMKLGAFDFIAKPFTRAELRGIVKRALHLVAEVEQDTPLGAAAADASGGPAGGGPGRRTLGHNSWMVMQPDGTVLIGVERSFVDAVGSIQELELPEVGDQLEQGSVCLRVYSADLDRHSVWSPLSGEVTEVNRKLREDPAAALQDPYGEGWLLRLRPGNFEAERETLGL